jgi:general secretion pathway protein M
MILDAYIGRLRAWLAGLSQRERTLVLAAGGVLAAALLYFALVLPLQSMASRRETRVEQKSADLAWMRQVAPAVTAAAAAGGATDVATGESLVVLVDRTAREAGLGTALRDQSPNGEAGLRLRLEAAAFDRLIEWLGQLQERHGVAIEAANFDATGNPGLVNASLTLAHPAGS